jgi:hypothetical protein
MNVSVASARSFRGYEDGSRVSKRPAMLLTRISIEAVALMSRAEPPFLFVR